MDECGLRRPACHGPRGMFLDGLEEGLVLLYGNRKVSRRLSPVGKTGRCERFVALSCNHGVITVPGKAGTRTFLAHHRAAFSAAVVLADATTISLAAPDMSSKLTMQGMSPLHVALLNRPRAGPP